MGNMRDTPPKGKEVPMGEMDEDAARRAKKAAEARVLLENITGEKVDPDSEVQILNG
jgi:hypothetical protein